MVITLPPRTVASPACVDELRRHLGHDAVSVDRVRRQRASRDHAWLSPVLSADLPDTIADVVVRPDGVDGLRAVLGVAHDHGVAVTPRGRGTGNYGQGVPLAGGIVLDSSGLGGVIDVEPGWIHAGAGTTFVELEAAAHETGQELAMFPSTTNSMLGGFLSGGAGGTGTLEHGFLWDGFVDSAEIVPCWAEPEARMLEGDEVGPHLHTYGTTGVIAAARVRLVPARFWTALLASFDSFDAAANAGEAALALDPVPRSLAVDDASLVEHLREHPRVDPHRASMRAIIDESTVEVAAEIVWDHGGRVDLVRADAIGYVVATSFNHVTLQAKRTNPGLCHLQVGGPALLERTREVRSVLPGTMLHLDGQLVHGERCFGGLLISRFVDREHLYRGMDRLRDLGVVVLDPHTWRLGAHGDAEGLRALAADQDPRGLLNPGKLP
ncbi:MAG: FAD-binding oxidoreductase [Actinomycetota bacterium]